MRLIDADVLERNMGIAWGESRITNDDWNLFRKILKETPTVLQDIVQVLAYECGKDSVQVVQCKDCIHNQVATRNHGIRDNPRCNFTNYVRSNEFFCGFGERRSE